MQLGTEEVQAWEREERRSNDKVFWWLQQALLSEVEPFRTTAASEGATVEPSGLSVISSRPMKPKPRVLPSEEEQGEAAECSKPSQETFYDTCFDSPGSKVMLKHPWTLEHPSEEEAAAMLQDSPLSPLSVYDSCESSAPSEHCAAPSLSPLATTLQLRVPQTTDALEPARSSSGQHRRDLMLSSQKSSSRQHLLTADASATVVNARQQQLRSGPAKQPPLTSHRAWAGKHTRARPQIYVQDILDAGSLFSGSEDQRKPKRRFISLVADGARSMAQGFGMCLNAMVCGGAFSVLDDPGICQEINSLDKCITRADELDAARVCRGNEKAKMRLLAKLKRAREKLHS